MTAVALVAGCDYVEARELTERIKGAAEQVWSLLLEAHERHAWDALGYQTWAEYVQTEFEMSRSRSYHLLDQAKVIREIGSVVPVSTKVDINEREVRDIKPVLNDVVRNVEARVAEIVARQSAEPAQAMIEQAVKEEIERGRELAKTMADRAKRADPAMAALLASVPDDYDAADDEARLNALGAIAHGVEEIAAITYQPADLGAWAHHTTLYHFADIRAVITFLSQFADAVEARA